MIDDIFKYIFELFENNPSVGFVLFSFILILWLKFRDRQIKNEVEENKKMVVGFMKEVSSNLMEERKFQQDIWSHHNEMWVRHDDDIKKAFEHLNMLIGELKGIEKK